MQQVQLKQLKQEFHDNVRLIGIGEKLYYNYKGKLIPKQFGWYLVLIMLVENGYKVVLHYLGNKTETLPKVFDFDPEYKGFAPMVPRKIEIFKEIKKEVKDEISDIFGPKYETKEVKVAEIINFNQLLDPDPNESFEMIDLLFDTIERAMNNGREDITD